MSVRRCTVMQSRAGRAQTGERGTERDSRPDNGTSATMTICDATNSDKNSNGSSGEFHSCIKR